MWNLKHQMTRKQEDAFREYVPESELEQRPPMDIVAPVLHEMLERAMVMGYVTESVGAIESHEGLNPDFTVEVSFKIRRVARGK